ncbi:MAG: hypothetical protein HeimC2_36320 [Candidatus Heimdallarchaeota archaeon LC_2]|nr:MAG: hypothetical protein HeimC2_36320 [Candidatus Heimdallarchaeota archaeon LC_2]
MLVLSSRTKNGLPVVKDRGNAVFVDPSRMRSRKKHRSKGTEPISMEPLLVKKTKWESDGDIGYRLVECEAIIFFDIRKCIQK